MNATRILFAAAAVAGSVLSSANAATIQNGATAVITQTFPIATENGNNTPLPPAVVAPAATYSNITNFLGTGIKFGDGTSAFSYAIADDLTNTLAAPKNISAFRFSIANFNTATTAITPYVRFFDDDGAGGNPGTLLGGFNFNAINVSAGSISTLTFSVPAASQFSVPTGKIWALQYFSTATAAATSNVGAGLFNPVNVGSSTVAEWDGTALAVDATSYAASSPSGAQYTGGYSNGTLPANYGWEISVVPEPTSLAALAGAGLVAFRRRKA